MLNSSAALYVCDLHEKYLNPKPDVQRLSLIASVLFVVAAVLLVPVYDGADSIINLVQKLNGLTSMPVLSVFIVGLLFSNVDARRPKTKRFTPSANATVVQRVIAIMWM